jgi:predicted transcriptional regulator
MSQLMNEKKVEVAYDILRYLIKNPSAQDTIKGVVDWWLLERKTKYQRRLVKQALDMMVKHGLVIARKKPDSQFVYKLYRPRRKKQLR